MAGWTGRTCGDNMKWDEFLRLQRSQDQGVKMNPEGKKAGMNLRALLLAYRESFIGLCGL